MYELVCPKCGETFKYKVQVYDGERTGRCLYCGTQLMVQEKEEKPDLTKKK